MELAHENAEICIFLAQSFAEGPHLISLELDRMSIKWVAEISMQE